MAGELTTRLDKLLMERNSDFSRSRIEGLIKAGFVKVNGVVAVKAGQKVSTTDNIEMSIPPPVPAIPEKEDIALDIIYEDDDIIAVNKAPDMVVHPAPGHFSGTLVNALLNHIPNLSGIGGVARPGIVHRLDMETSGIIIAAKTQAAMDRLTREFASHTRIRKTYLAIVHGAFDGLKCGRIETLIGRHPVDRKRMAIVEKNGKFAITNWRVLDIARCDLPLSALECNIETGRTHQIRVHAASYLKHPIIGDKVYGKSVLDKRLAPVPARQMLHAWKLELRHPITGAALCLQAPLPDDMKPYLTENL